jgi:L-lactate utilization protein LutC
MERKDFLARLSSSISGDQSQQDASAQSELPERRVLAARERVDLFVSRLHELGVEARVVSSREDARDALERLVNERAWSGVACAPGLRWPGISETWTAEAAEAPFGLCEADWAVAETGTILVMSSAEVRRGYSLLPPAVGFFVSECCICPTVGDVLHELAAADPAFPSCISFISGPSNTADIASVHVVGVHGPSEVHVWVIAETASAAVDHGCKRPQAQEK